MTPPRLYSLDAARGLAALAVVVWHWQHMYWLDGHRQIDRTEQPFYTVLSPFYEAGYIGVDFFFVLSGFIFYWLYSEKITRGQSDATDFALLRFSRLYPLHILTLTIVVALQAMRPADFVYPASSNINFVMQLFLIQSWAGIENGATFNGPAWSVSVEIFLYVVFWTICRIKWGSSVATAVGFGVLGSAVAMVSPTIGMAIAGFFFGGVAFYAWRRLIRTEALWMIPAVLALFGWIAAVALAPLLSEQTALLGRIVLFPTTVLAIALIESRVSLPFEKLAWLGDISYSSYLLHFPLQLVIANLVLLGWLSSDTAQGEVVFAVFFAVLIALSLVSFRWFERPMQDAIRRSYIKPTPPPRRSIA